MDKQKIRHDRKIRAANYKIGDLVLVLDMKNRKKINQQWFGSFKIVEKFGVDYKIDIGNSDVKLKLTTKTI